MRESRGVGVVGHLLDCRSRLRAESQEVLSLGEMTSIGLRDRVRGK